MAELIRLKARGSIWDHCELNDIFSLVKKENLLNVITLNEQAEEEAAIRPGILHFFCQRTYIFIRKKSGNFEKGCLWQPCYLSSLYLLKCAMEASSSPDDPS